MPRFKKNCHLKTCLKPFESDSRNTAYCSDPCADAAKKRSNARVKRKRGYQKDAPNRRAQSMSRREFRAEGASDMAVSICQSCAKFLFVRDLEFHHRDGNPFNNVPDNRACLCHPCHVKADIAWRQAKEAGKPIEEVRRWVLELESTSLSGGGVVTDPTVRRFVPDSSASAIPATAVV